MITLGRMLTGSMTPTIPIGSYYFIIKTPYKKIKVGHIISFYMDGNFITHRVIEITPDGFFTKGDNNPHRDWWFVTEREYQGRAIIL